MKDSEDDQVEYGEDDQIRYGKDDHNNDGGDNHKYFAEDYHDKNGEDDNNNYEHQQGRQLPKKGINETQYWESGHQRMYSLETLRVNNKA